MTAMPLVLMTEDEVAGYGRDDGGFGALRTDRGLLPLIAMDVDARIAGVIASIEVAQTFVNTTGAAIEATYIFPLPDRAAVNRFRMEVGGRVVEGVVEERGAAREQYDQAIRSGHRAAITEEERPGTFTLRVGNLLPGEAATVRISLVGPLPIDDGEVTFRFPLVVAPRYMPGTGLGGDQAGLGIAQDTTLVPDASRISPPVLLPGCPNPVRLGLRVAFQDRNVREVVSSLHAVTTTLHDAQHVEVRPGERLDRDFILRWHIDAAELRSTLVCQDDGAMGTFMLTLVPPSTKTLSAKPRDVVFVIDRSGSMEGWKMVAARRAAARMIDSLTSRDRFSVIAFDDHIETLPAPDPTWRARVGSHDVGLLAASDRNRFRAVEALAKIDSRGGTELAEPLRMAVRLLAGGHDDRQRVVVLVTDGQVGDEDHILRELAPNLRNVRMFTLGIDQAVNAGFLRRLAGAGGGLCELVESEDRLDAVMAKVHQRIGTPVATELSIRSSSLDLDSWTIAPNKLPDVYAGAPVVILGRYRGIAPTGASIDIEGTSLGDPMKLTIVREPSPEATNVIAGPVPTNSWLAASWARAHIRELEDRYAAGVHAVEAEIITASKRFGVLSRFTAFLAIDRSQIANPGGKLQQVVQPVESPAGWKDAAPKAMASRPSPGRMAPSADAFISSEDACISPPAAYSRAPMRPAGTMPAARSSGPAPRSPRPAESSPGPSAMPVPCSPAASYDADESYGADASFDVDDASPPAESAAMPAASYPPPAQAIAPRSPAYAANTGGRSQHEAPLTEAYRDLLTVLAQELADHATANDGTAIRLIRQRLTEWIEDLRSFGGAEQMAREVEVLVQRLSAALRATTALVSEAQAIAAELLALARGGSVPKTSRPSFWK